MKNEAVYIARNPAYKAARRHAMAGTKRYIVMKGGRGSGKSWEFANIFIDKCLRDPHRRVLATRKIKKDCKGSVLRQTTDVLRHLGIYERVHVNENEGIINYPNGAQFLTAGLDDPDKLKSYAGLTDVWMEEAYDCTENDMQTLDLGIRGPHAHDATIGLSFNPINWRSWLKQRFFDTDDPDVFTLSTTYRDNMFNGRNYERVLHKIRDEQTRKVLIEGEWGEDITGLCFPYWTPVATMPEGGKHCMGLDFGINDPTVLMEVRLIGNDLYLRCLYYERKKTAADFIAWAKENGIQRVVPIIADSSGKDEIEQIYRAGFNIHPAEKGPGSVVSGIKRMQQYKIHVVQDAEHLQFETEMRFYKWDKDKNGIPLDKPIDEMNHGIDASRYGTMYLGKPQLVTGVIGALNVGR